MPGRYAVRDVEQDTLDWLTEWDTHDSRGYCTSECVPQYHGGRHAEVAS